jgi:PAS domain S-box-containing protein
MKNSVKLTFVDNSDYEVNAVKGIAYSLDLRGNFRFVSEAGRQLCGYSSEELRQMNAQELLSREAVKLISREIWRAARQPVGAVYEIEIITKDRRRVVLETSIRLVLRNGHAIGIHGIALPPLGRAPQSRPRCLDANFVNGFVTFGGPARD